MNHQLSRRQFLTRSSLAAAGVWIARSSWANISPNEKLNLGVIGTANRAGENLHAVSCENIVALCDVDETFLAKAKRAHPGAKTYTDFRKLLEQKNLDAVVVGTADHTHAVATVAALKQGYHVYCEKPLTHTVSEARIVAETARKHRRVTQMGTQIHAMDNYRRVVEKIQSGAIGPVRDVHVWVNVVYAGGDRPKETPKVPSNLHWDLWLGPAAYRPYHPAYVPRSWRQWWDFGGGGLGDFGCHFIDVVYWALGLRYPLSIETEGPPVHPEGTPQWLIARYQYAAQGAQPALGLTWYHGVREDKPVRPPFLADKGVPPWESAVLFIGDKGMLLTDYSRHVLLPEKDFEGYVPPPQTIAPSIGHHAEWINAIKNGGRPLCNFDYAGTLTEAVLLGNAAYRSGGKIIWDPQKLRALGNRAADRFIQHHYRRGWSIS